MKEKSSLVNKILKIWYCIFGLVVGLSLFYFGNSRVSMGIAFVEDPYVAHSMSVGLMYIQISLLILLALAVVITYSLIKNKNNLIR